ncbi:MAG: transposase [Desulfobacterales bacterium]
MVSSSTECSFHIHSESINNCPSRILYRPLFSFDDLWFRISFYFSPPPVHCQALPPGFRKSVGQLLSDLCQQKRVELVEGHLMPDHIHICLSVPPNFSIAFMIGS